MKDNVSYIRHTVMSDFPSHKTDAYFQHSREV